MKAGNGCTVRYGILHLPVIALLRQLSVIDIVQTWDYIPYENGKHEISYNESITRILCDLIPIPTSTFSKIC